MDRNPYDDMPYESLPFSQTHPERLAALARLYGLAAPDPRTARVLELGCAAGGNLLPLAVQFPRADLVGVDSSSRQIADGQQVVDALGLANVRLVAAGIETIDSTWGEFDYILCHGVYSWVPPAIQDSILAVCRARLRPEGVAYVSYNTLPGWRMRGAIRDLMREHALQFELPTEQVTQARAMLDFLAQAAQVADPAYKALLQQELNQLTRAPDSYIFHEHLEAVNEPVYFREFVARAEAHGLAFVTESDFAGMLGNDLPAEVASTIERLAPGIVRQQQLLDFVRNRSFRQSLLVHDERAIDRTNLLARIEQLWLASPLQPQGAGAQGGERFAAPHGPSVTSSAALTVAALHVLAAHWPLPLPWQTLLAQATQRVATAPDAQALHTLRVDLLNCYAGHLLDLHTGPGACTRTVSVQPVASPLARYQAGRGLPVTTLRHLHLTLDEPARALLSWLDGSTPLASLVARWTTQYPQLDAGGCSRLLEDFARAGLLSG